MCTDANTCTHTRMQKVQTNTNTLAWPTSSLASCNIDLLSLHARHSKTLAAPTRDGERGGIPTERSTERDEAEAGERDEAMGEREGRKGRWEDEAGSREVCVTVRLGETQRVREERRGGKMQFMQSYCNQQCGNFNHKHATTSTLVFQQSASVHTHTEI